MTTLRAALGLVALFCLAGCPGPGSHGNPDGGDSDAGVDGGLSNSGTDGGFSFASEEDVRLALNTLVLPYLMAFTIPEPGTVMGSCPALATTATGWTGAGGCVDQQGVTYQGSFAVSRTQNAAGGVDYAFDFNGYGAAADGGEWANSMDGHVAAALAPSTCGFPGPNPLVADLFHVSLSGNGIQNFGGFFPGPGKSADLTFVGYQMAWDLNCAPRTITSHGQVVVKDRGTFSIDSSRQENGSCSHDPSGGTSVFAGANTVTLSYDGASPCDSCVPYASDTGLSGSLCWQ